MNERDVPEPGGPYNFRLIPGMTLTASIKVGSRTVLSYIARGLLRNLNEGMRYP